MIFQEAFLTGMFPEWKRKKRNIVPNQKKNDKQNINNYRPMSLVPICGKIFGRFIFNEMFNYFSANKLISKSPSGF